MIQHITWISAALFITLGVFGFVPGITTDEGLVLGVFLASPMQSLLYIVVGCAALFAVGVAGRYAVLFFQMLGILALVVAPIGFVTGEVFDLFSVNTPDNVFHALVAMGALWVGFGIDHDESASPFQRV